MGILLLLVCYFFNKNEIILKIENHAKNGRDGPWKNFKNQSLEYMQSDKFRRLFTEKICNYNKAFNELEKVATMSTYLSYLIEDKLIKHCIDKNEQEAFNKNNIRRIMQHLIALISVLYGGDIKVRTGLFLVSKDNRYLYPYILDGINYGTFHNLDDESEVHKISKSFFSITRRDIFVTDTYLNQKPMSKNSGIKNVLGNKHPYMKSIFGCPLKFNEDVYSNFKDEFIWLPIEFGVFCVDCNNENIFSEENNDLNMLLIKPFADRIVYEFSLGIHNYNKEKK